MKTRNTQILLLVLALAFNLPAFGQATNASFVEAGPMFPAGGPRVGHTATLLPNGKVLVAGGSSTGYSSNTLASAVCYDPASYAWGLFTGSSAWTLTGSMNAARSGHTATLLPNGKVLVVGGSGTNGPLSSTELYDPATGTWTTTGSLQAARYGATASLLPSGRVLVVGGIGTNFLYGNPLTLSSAELYDPATGTWTSTGSLNTDRTDHTATLLPSGKVLVAGGVETATIYYKEAYWDLASAEVYDPASGTWTATGSLNTTRYFHRATLLPSGKVLATGGQSGGFYFPPGYNSSAELYDPATGLWTNTGSMNAPHAGHTATLLPNGKLLVAGGWGYQYSSQIYTNAEVYDPTTGTWAISATLNEPRKSHTATLLANGEVLLVGGQDVNNNVPVDTELYERATGAWATTGALNYPHAAHAATLLPSGKVLVAGCEGYHDASPQAELYDPASGTWTTTGALNQGRMVFTLTLLPNGKVLAAGGIPYTVLASAELYDPAGGAWALTGSMNSPRYGHTATLLPNGKVLVAGGGGSNYTSQASAELYDPVAGTWTPTGSMTTARFGHTATLLPSGRVLVTGGYGSTFTGVASAELYDPGSGTWTATGLMMTTRYFHTATLLPNGTVLASGGRGGSYDSALNLAELYDPAGGTWTQTGLMTTNRAIHTATLLSNGKVLVAGGSYTNDSSFGGIVPPQFTSLANAELYDPASGTWALTPGSMPTNHFRHTATSLPNGKVLVAGGSGGYVSETTAQLYDVGLGFSASWQPQIATLDSPPGLGGGLALTGIRFRGVSEGSGGNTQDSPADYPLVQLRSLANEQTLFLPATNWSATSFISAPLGSFAPGYMLITVFANGIPSASSIGVFPFLPTLTPALSGGNAGLAWSANCPGYVLETTPTLKPAVWTVVPGTPATLNGQYVLSVTKTNPSQFFRLALCDAGAALSFDGATTYVSVGASALPTPWTAEFWVNRQNATDPSATLIGDNTTALKLEQYNNTRQVGFTRFGVADYLFNYSAPVGTWVHLAFVSDTTTRLYVNGVLQDTLSATIPLPLGRLGYDSSGFADHMQGMLDEVRVWNVARTPAQIQASMNHSLSVPQANLVGYWKFDEGNGTSAFDSSGQGNTGTLQNAPASVISTAPIVP